MSKFSLSKRSIKNTSGIDPRLIEIRDLAITLTLIDFGHGQYAGLRSAATQHTLFIRDASSRDGFDKISLHQSGRALDFYAYINGAASWKHEHLAMVACAFFQAASILGYKIEWGGLWPDSNNDIYGYDCPHIQLVD